MHALNLHSLFEDDPDNGGNLLDTAIDEFSGLIDKSTGQQRLDNVISLCAALYDKSEVAPDTSDEVLDRIVELANRWLPEYSAEVSPSGNARLNLFLAQALQILGERAEDDLALAESEAAYNQAIGGFLKSRNPGGLLTDAKSGLAGVLQVRGEKAKDPEMLRRAVTLHRELVEVSRAGERSKEEAGPFENLAGSLGALAKLVRAEEATVLYGEAKDAFERAIRIYERQGEKELERLAREELEGLEAAMSGKEK
jgi:tetratricopeptide (TPR) repeat protein